MSETITINSNPAGVNLSKCWRCLALKEFVYQMPCCTTSEMQFCASCIRSTARCFLCQSHFDMSKCKKVFAVTELIAQIQYKLCPYEKCAKPLDIILYDFHVRNCPFKPTTSPSMIEQLDPNFVDHDTLKKENVEKNYLRLYASQFDRKTGTYQHIVLPTDTLTGLTLRYGLTSQEIKAANNLWSGNIHERSVLKLPIKDVQKIIFEESNEEVMKKRIINKFRAQTQITTESEALFYLDANDFDLDRSVASFVADREWEKNNPIKKSALEQETRVDQVKETPKKTGFGICSFGQVSV